MTRRWFAWVAMCGAVLGVSSALSAQSTRAQIALDAWIVSRFQSVQLLEDSVALSTRAAGSQPLLPLSPLSVRIESARDGEALDSLFATSLSVGRVAAGLSRGMRVRLGAASGSISGVAGVVVARRLFRAPVRPLSARPDSAWRYGWAYLATTRAIDAKIGAAAYRGWLLFPPPDSAKSAGSSRRATPPSTHSPSTSRSR